MIQWMKNRMHNDLDERQLLMRGNAYHKGISLLYGLILLNVFVKSFFHITWADGDWDYLLISLTSIFYIVYLMLSYDVYNLFQRKWRILFGIIGLYGIGYSSYLLYCIYGLQMPAMQGSTLTSEGAFLILALEYVIIFIAYLWFTYQYNKESE